MSPWWRDSAERVASAFFLALASTVLLAGADVLSLSTWHAAAVAGVTAALVAVKSLVAARIGGTVSPASLAPGERPTRPVTSNPTHLKITGLRMTGVPVGLPANKDAKKPRLKKYTLPESVTDGKRLGRHVHHDPRSRAFPYHAAPAETLRSVRHTRHAKVFDQGQVGSCTGNACAGALSTSPFKHRFTESRALKLYSAAEVIDGDGPYPPNDEGSSGLSVAKAAQQEGYVTSYAHCFSPDAVYTALQSGPVLVGVNWLTGFDEPTADGQMVYKGSSRGGHELVLDEIDVENQRVWVTNSWGLSFGIAGRAWWSFSDFAKVLADDGDATVLN